MILFVVNNWSLSVNSVLFKLPQYSCQWETFLFLSHSHFYQCFLFEVERICFMYCCTFGLERWHSAVLKAKEILCLWNLDFTPNLETFTHPFVIAIFFCLNESWMQFSTPAGLCYIWYGVPTTEVSHISHCFHSTNIMVSFLKFATIRWSLMSLE